MWKDKRSTNKQAIVYLTDYKEVREDGKVKIDNYGYLDVELVHSSSLREECIEAAQRLIKSS
ncbi:hypothetical protein [Lacibacter cauensis]|uniref:hypothetical protein n=1 Tax=Lacibacter cauensis TaxID=510947 RepID=UPI0011AA7522|nr:hypothetical protein [Lacibacter cauensis]